MGKDQLTNDNDHIAEYLKFYINTKLATGYGVLVSGDWGAGKTWFIKKFQSEMETEPSGAKFLYASFYGVRSTSEIEDQFYQQLHPLLASKPFAIGSKIFKGLLKGTLKIDFDRDGKDDGSMSVQIPELDLPSYLKDTDKYVLIFDDIERSSMSIQDILGYVNHFVEHQGQKVILLGNETELQKNPEYSRINEKLIGRKFRLVTMHAAAFEAFVRDIESEVVRNFFEANSGLILGEFDKTGCQNLRILRQILSEFERFYGFLPEKARDHQEFLIGVLVTFISLSAEVLSGQLPTMSILSLSSDFHSRQIEEAVKKKGLDVEANSVRIFKKYFSSADQILPDERSLYTFLEYGSVPKSIIEKAVTNSRFFINDETPEWVKLWHLNRVADSDFPVLYDAMLNNFKEFKYTNQGILRHVSAILLDFSKKGIVDIPRAEMVKLVFGVVRQMITASGIEVEAFEKDFFGRADEFYASLQFIDHGSKEFKKLSGLLGDYQSKKRSEAIERDAVELLRVVKNHPKEFIKALTSFNSTDKRRYYEVPILAKMSPDDLVQTFLDCNPDGRQDILFTFVERYKFAASARALLDELPWLQKVEKSIARGLKGLAQPSRHHLETFRDQGVHVGIAQLKKLKSKETA
ncbi:KAP family NTPase [bacterium]|nr:KAP family NTPase [bacterium]